MQLRHKTPLLLLGTVLSLFSATANAAPIPAGISVASQSYLDTVNSSAGYNANQSGEISIRSGGSDNTSGFIGIGIDQNPLNGNATITGDGSALQFALGGGHNGDIAQNDGLFGDLYLNFSNNNLLAYKARVAVDVAYSSVFASGSDAFVKFDFSLQDSAANELFYSSLMRDTVNGDSDAASVSNIVEILLNPGDSFVFHGIQKAYGGAFAERSSYSGIVSARLEVLDFTAIPEPSGILLLGLGFGMLLGKRYFS